MASKPDQSTDTRERVRRAVSERDKQERRASILAAAGKHFSDAGYERFSMEVLAKQLGMARGTLYRYFGTREELLLALYLDRQRRFVNTLIDRMNDGMSDEAFVRLFYEITLENPTLTALRLRLASVIEHNVNMVVLVDTKRAMMEDFEKLSRVLGRRLQLKEADARQLIVALLALVLGAAQADASPVIDPALLPEDVRELMAGFRSKPVFIDNAMMILEGLRRKA